ncbi:MAG: VOC family protein, partial [Flavobacteriales bacterium]
MKAKNPVVWFEIYVDDMPRAKKFYETVLGLQLESMATPDTIEANMEMVSF